MTPEQERVEREAFEKWWYRDFPTTDKDLLKHKDLGRNNAWTAWLARAQLQPRLSKGDTVDHPLISDDKRRRYEEYKARNGLTGTLEMANAFYSGMSEGYIKCCEEEKQPVPSKSDEEAAAACFERTRSHRWWGEGMNAALAMKFVRDAWAEACAHKEAQRAGDDEVIRELAEALQTVFTINHLAYPWLGQLLTKHATRIAAARGENG